MSTKLKYLQAVLRGHALKGAPQRVRLLSEQELYETFLTIKDDDTYESFDDFKKFFPAEQAPQQQASQTKRKVNEYVHEGERLVTKDGFDATTILEADKELRALRNEEGLQAMQILSRIPGVPIKVEFKKAAKRKSRIPPATEVTGTEG